MGLYQIKEPLYSKETDKMKKGPTDWENIFTSDIPNKGLISKIYKELYNSTPETQRIQFKNGQRISKTLI